MYSFINLFSFQNIKWGYNNHLRLSISWILLILIAFVFLSSPANAADTEMMHTPPDYFIPDNRIQLIAQVEDDEGVKLVRCYFKAAGEANLVFVPMNTMGSDKYSGVLPAPSVTTDRIEYLFLSVNNAKEVVRSQTFTMTKNAEEDLPAWQEIPKEGEIKVSMELDKVPTELRGFSDNVTIDMVESGARFGVVALLYYHITDDDSSKKGGTESGTSSSASGSTASATATGSTVNSTTAGSTTSSAAVASATAATGATSAGFITAGTVGWSTAAIIGVGLGTVAVAGGTVAAVNAIDDNDDDDNNGDDVIVTKCDSATFPGGDTPETHSVNLGQKSGTFNFSYETYGQEDRMIVSYEGNVLFDTGCLGTNGTRTQAISYAGGSSRITVEVIPNCAGGSGTAWEFTVNCPQ